MKFIVKGCKHLSYDQDKYPARRVTGLHDNHACWERIDADGKLQLVQFCNLRGRLDDPESCITYEKSYCNHYEDFEHEVIRMKYIPIEKCEGCRYLETRRSILNNTNRRNFACFYPNKEECTTSRTINDLFLGCPLPDLPDVKELVVLCKQALVMFNRMQTSDIMQKNLKPIVTALQEAIKKAERV